MRKGMINACGVALCLGFAFQAQAASVGQQDPDRLLERADAARSADVKTFQRLLDELNVGGLVHTDAQREKLQYLNAYAQTFRGDYAGGIAAAQRLLDATQDVDMKVRAGALIVNTRAISHDFTAGLRQLEQTLALADKVRNPDYREHILGVAAVIHNQMGQYRLAQQYAERVLASTRSARARCFAGQSRTEAMQHLGVLSDADAESVVELCASLKEKVVANLARIDQARKWAASEQRERAIDLLRGHLDEIHATHYPVLIGEAESLLAELALDGGRTADAEAHAEAALSLISSMQFTQALASSYQTLYRIANSRGDVKSALSYYQRFAEADKAYLNEVKARELAYQIVRQETAQKSQQIELLDRKNQVLQLQQKVNEQTAQSSRLMILLLLVLATSIGYWAYKTRRMHASLRRMAETDVLTSVCNRRHFQQQAELVLQQCARGGEDVAMIMFDLDHFKSINDRFGHTTGDWVLRHVADTCTAFCRKIDRFGRLGGEEFAILLPGCDLRAATRIAEDCRMRLASIDTSPSGHKFLVTASFGVTATASSGYDLAKLLSHADMLLYRAKREGRNRVCRYDGEMQPWTQMAVVDGRDVEPAAEPQTPAIA